MSSPTIIEDVRARRVLDSRGDETIEVDVYTAAGMGRAAAPMGASRGEAEVKPYPEGGIEAALEEVERTIAPELMGMDACDQRAVDELLHELDDTPNFERIGGNTAYAVSLASAEAAANSLGIPLYQHIAGVMARELPYPLGNVIGGGRHVRGLGPDFQEFLVIPIGAGSFLEAARVNVQVHRRACELLREVDHSFAGGKGDEGAWATTLGCEEILSILSRACQDVLELTGVECRVGVDVAASTLWSPEEGVYVYRRENVRKSPGEQLEYIIELIERYNLAYVEDPLMDEDFEGFSELVRRTRNCLICGDDLFSTNRRRLERGIREGAANSIIIKPNQIGTLTDAWEAAKLALSKGYVPIVSHRSGESTGAHIAHLAVAFNCPLIKTGVVGGERVAKLNELIRIEETLGMEARMAELRL